MAWKIGEYSNLECEWYVINLTIDCALGVFLQYIILTTINEAIKNTRYDYESGNYYSGDQFIFKEYIYQLTIWVLVVILSKLISLGLVVLCYNVFNELGEILLRPLTATPKLKLIFVMLICPIVLNVLQFWFTDSFLQMNQEIKEKDYFYAPTAKDDYQTIDFESRSDKKKYSKKLKRDCHESEAIKFDIQIKPGFLSGNEEEKKSI